MTQSKVPISAVVDVATLIVNVKICGLLIIAELKGLQMPFSSSYLIFMKPTKELGGLLTILYLVTLASSFHFSTE